MSAFSVRTEDFVVTGSATASFERTAESGHRVHSVHCGICGSRLYAQSDGNQALVGVFATTLDHPSQFLPVSNVYLSEASHWIVPDENLMNFDRMPGR